MKIRWILVVLMLLLVYPQIAVAKSQYGNINLYYNDQLLPRGEVAKPTLKIGEPFTVAVEMTMYQYGKVYVEILDLGTDLGFNHFVVIDGPSDMGESYDKLFQENETYTFEWTLKATDEWTGGTMPINFHYTIYVLVSRQLSSVG